MLATRGWNGIRRSVGGISLNGRYSARPTLSGFSTRMITAVTPEQIPSFNHLVVEPKWQQYWEENKTFRTPDRTETITAALSSSHISPTAAEAAEAAAKVNLRPKKYILDMFPYPSGSGLHVGHPEGYTATDILSRYYRMNGYDVLHPMGWDSFGLPAEQHAILTGTHPRDTTYTNIDTFRRQLKALGFSYDWDREMATTDENYVRWTQWIFLQLYKSGLAEQSEVTVNWCPKLGTVLANEEVINGLSERGNHPVERLPLRQWVLKITKYADRLEEGLEGLKWPEGTRVAQKSWIGRSEGAVISFQSKQGDSIYPIEVFTTRPDTLAGVTYVVLAPEHPLVEKLTTPEQREAVQAYVSVARNKSDLERTTTSVKTKTGVFTGSKVIHPLTGEEVPVWTADYVLAQYGTGAVMAVPAHDERDFSFAKTFDLPIKQVITAPGGEELVLPYVDDGILIESGEFTGLESSAARKLVTAKLTEKQAGEARVTYKLRDWNFSRQRYWGEPIPIYFPVDIHDASGKTNPLEGAEHTIRYDQPIAVEESELPLRLPETDDFHPGDDPQGCLARLAEWRYFQKDGKWYARETNTMPQWAGSCWYYLRFADPKNDNAFLSRTAEAAWLPVDLYVGGQEHAVLHLLYARFWHAVLYDLGLVRDKEPFTQLVHQGMILGSDGEKMSKSRGNVINPDDIVQAHGADALRLYEMFMGPLEAVKPWQSSQVMGVVRFRDRVYSLLKAGVDEAPHPAWSDSTLELPAGVEGEAIRTLHRTVKKVTSDIEKLSFNTAISSLMVFTNSLTALKKPIPRVALENLVLMLSPFAPHVAEECWSLLGHTKTLAFEEWPKYDEAMTTVATANIAVQVNGKLRGKLEGVPLDMTQEEAFEEAFKQSSVRKFVGEATPKKIVFVPGKILSIIV